MGEESNICADRSPGGWYCVLLHGHAGPHMSLRNNLMWRGSPGRPVFWELSAETTEEVELLNDGTRATAEVQKGDKTERRLLVQPLIGGTSMGFVGDPCDECGAFLLKRNGSCLVCTGCGATTGCS